MLRFEFIRSEQNPADILTKALDHSTAWAFVDTLLFRKGNTERKEDEEVSHISHAHSQVEGSVAMQMVTRRGDGIRGQPGRCSGIRNRGSSGRRIVARTVDSNVYDSTDRGQSLREYAVKREQAGEVYGNEDIIGNDIYTSMDTGTPPNTWESAQRGGTYGVTVERKIPGSIVLELHGSTGFQGTWE